MRFAIFALIFFGTLSFSVPSLSAQNNKFGIHLAVTTDEDIQKAADLVNSNGGSYGYITLVIQENNRDVGYWQGVFDKLREKKLIPIVRLATQPEGEYWRAPNPEDAAGWAHFLNQLHWVVKDRYIILFNEPNHASEWGGQTDAKKYGEIAAEFAYELKAKSSDFRIMLAGMDLAAPQAPPRYREAHTYISEAAGRFCDQLKSKGKNCSEYIDLISSHAYPNPAFAGNPADTGQRSIRGYTYEISWYQELFGREYPVMITETGWDAGRVGQSVAAEYFRSAFRDVWLPDPRVLAVTPFVLNYQGAPFLPFSFLTPGDAVPYPKYRMLQSMIKVAGDPAIIDDAVITIELPSKLVEDSFYEIPFSVKNIGQRIWDRGVYTVEVSRLHDPTVDVTARLITLPQTRPFQIWRGSLHIETGKALVSEGTIGLDLRRTGALVTALSPQKVQIQLQPTLTTQVELLSKGLSTGSDFELQVFDSDEHLVYAKRDYKVALGRGHTERISNVVPDRTYRIVILKPYYLPRQQILTLRVGENAIKFEKLLPLDFNRDGQLTSGDLTGLFTVGAKDDIGFLNKLQLLLPN